MRDGVIKPVVGAVEAGFQEEDAGIGPIQTRIIDEDNNDVDLSKSAMSVDLTKWQRKAENSLAKGKGAKVDFESEVIPSSVMEYVFDRLDNCSTKTAIANVFGVFG